MVAVNQQSTLTPALKDFLKSIDGKTSPEQLVALWRDGPDAVRLLHELERRGLIEVRAARWANSSANSSFSASLSPLLTSSFADSAAPISAPASASPAFDAPTVPAALDNPGAQRSTAARTAAELDEIKDHMSTFILTHLPQHAIAVLKEIEDVDSYDRLMLMLTAYADMAHEAGRAGLAHIKSLRSLLEPGYEGSRG